MLPTLVVKTAPAEEPVDLATAKLHAKVETAEDNAKLLATVQAMRESGELFTGRTWVRTVYTLKLEAFPAASDRNPFALLELPRPPIVAVDAIRYVDGDGAAQVLAPASYQVVAGDDGGYVCPAHGESWPTTRAQPHAVEVDYQAGWANAAAVPARFREGVLLWLAHLYVNREAVVVGTSAAVVPLSVLDLWSLGRLTPV